MKTLPHTKNTFKMTLLLTVIICIGSVPSQNFAEPIDVSPGESIQQAIDRAESGDIINVAPGDFEEDLIIKNGISVEGAGPGKTNLIGFSGVSPVPDPTIIMEDNTSISGFSITSSTQSAIKATGLGVEIENNHIDADFNAIKVENGEAIIIENRIGPFVHSGIHFDKSNGSIINNTIETNHVGIILENSNALILRNIISGKSWNKTRGGNTGLSLEKSSPTITNNIIYGHKIDGIFAHTNSDAKIVNNTLYDNYRHGILCHHSSPEITNNIIMSSESGIYNVGESEPEITFNNLYENSIGKYITRDNKEFTPAPGSGEMSAAPQFADIEFDDAPAGNFELLSGSACIDKGNPENSFNDPDGTANDIGAYGGPDSDWIGKHELPQINIYSNGTQFAEGSTLTITMRTSNFNPDQAEVNKFIVLSNPAIGFLFYPSWGTQVDFEKLTLPPRYENTDTLLSVELVAPVPSGEYILYVGLSNQKNEFPAGIKSLSFNIVNKPVAKFTVTPKSGKVMQTVFYVDASESSDVETPKAILQFRWRWDAGANFTDWTTMKKAQHKYPAAGTKTITLEVQDQDGFTSSASETVEVNE